MKGLGRRLIFWALIVVSLASASAGDIPLIVGGRTDTTSGNGMSGQPAVLPDGSGILFLSTASNLTTNNHRARTRQVYSLETVGSKLTLLTVASNSTFPMNADCEYFFLSPDSSRVGIRTLATDLAPGSLWKSSEIFQILLGSSEGRYWRMIPRVNVPIAPETRRSATGWLGDSSFIVANAVAPSDAGVARVFSTSFLIEPNSGASTAFPFSGALGTVLGGATNLVIWIESSPRRLRASGRVSGFFYSGVYLCDSQTVLDATATGDGQFIASRLSSTNSGFTPLVWSRFLPDVPPFGGATNLFLGEIPLGTGELNGHSKLLISQDGNRIFYIGGYRDIRWETNTPLPGLLPICINSNGTVMVARDLTNAGFQHVVFNIETGASQVVHNGATPPVPLEFAMDFSMSADGNVIAFATTEDPTALGDRNGEMDVFRVSPTNMTPVLVSRALPGNEVVPDGRFFKFSQRLMSTNGRYAGFVTSTPIAPTDTNGRPDLYILDRWTGSNIWASAAADGVTAGRGSVVEACLSANGKMAVFTANSTNLPGTAVFVNGVAPLNVFAFDLESRQVRCLSLGDLSSNWANADCINPVIDASGNTVVFVTSASSVLPAGASGPRLVAAFLTNQTRSVLAANRGAAPRIVLPSISDDGQFVASFMDPTDQSYGYLGNVLFHDLVAKTNILLQGIGAGGSVTRPFVSKDGRFIVAMTNRAFVVVRDNSSGNVTLTAAPWVSPAAIRGTAIGAPLPIDEASLSQDSRYMLVGYLANNLPGVLDLQTGQVEAMELGGTKPSLPVFSSARLSPSGRRILFTSAQQELEPGEREWLSRVWVYDRVTKSLELLSPETGTGLRFSGAGAAYWLGDESGVIFSGGSGFQVLSLAGDQMLPTVRRIALVASDTDGDGLDDDWERLSFGSLAKNGTDDEDEDGLGNYAEFIGGSNPKDASSGLRPVTQTVSGGSRRLEWPASPGVGYRVEYSASLAQGSWTPLTNIVANLGNIATCTDPNTAGVSNRFYRVIAVP